MAQSELRQFFRQKTAKAASDGIDWEAKRRAYVRGIEDLYKKVTEEYLAGPIKKDKTVTVSYVDKQIAEDFVGEYTVRELVLQVGMERVVFCPKGTNIVGATGRIDLRGDMGEVTIVRQPRGRWSVVASRLPDLKLVEMNEQSLLTALRSVMRP